MTSLNRCLRLNIDIMFCVPEQHRRVIPAVGCAVGVRLEHGPKFLSLRVERESLEILLTFILLDFESSLCGGSLLIMQRYKMHKPRIFL